MANNCDFHMKIRGRKDDCRELADLLAWKNGHEKDGIGRIYLCQVVDEGPGWLEVAGDCAWSVQTAILEPQGGRFAEDLARLDLAVEVYSSEPGLQFQEHYVIDRGDVLVEEEVEYKEYWVEEMGREELAEVAEELGLTPDYLMENMNEWGDYRVGGFESWDFSYIPSPSRPSIEVLARDFARFAAADGARDVLRDYFPYGLEGMDESGIRSLLEGSLAKRSFEMDMGNAGSSSRGRNETAREEVRRLLLEGEDFYNVRDGRTVMPYISMPGYGDGEDGEGGIETPVGDVLYGLMTKTVPPEEARDLDYDIGMHCRESFPAPGTGASDRLGFVDCWQFDEMVDEIASEDGWCLADPEHVAEAFAELDGEKAGFKPFQDAARLAEAASRAEASEKAGRPSGKETVRDAAR